MSQDTPTVDPLRFALSPWAFTGDEIALVRKRLEEAMRAALSATQPAQAAQGEPVQGVPDGWEIREDDTWIYFKRPDGFCQAVTPNDPHTSHAQTLHMLMRAMLTSSPTPPAQPAVAQGAGEVVAWVSVDSIGERYLTFGEPGGGRNCRPLTYADTQPAAGADVLLAIATVRESYRGTDWGKVAECICDAIDAAIAASGRKS